MTQFDQMRMGEGLRRWHPSLAGVMQYFSAPRLDLPQGLFWSDVDIVDVSFWQGEIDFVRMMKSGIRGVIIRAGQNVWPDKMFETNWRNAKRAGLSRGSYWLYDSRAEPKAQADLYCEMLKDDRGELPMVADYEENYRGAFRGWKRLYDFLERLKAKPNKVPHEKLMIYTGYWYWMANSPQTNPAGLNYFLHYPLWLAYYNTNPKKVRIPKPWKDAILWQWGTPAEGLMRGAQSKEIDMNKFTGTVEEFERWPLQQ